MGILTYNRDTFLMDGKPYTILSGAMHYFRIPREYWYDRLLKLKECGFNTVETYTPWNLHEPTEGTFDFTGNLDIVSFVETAKELGLSVILRPGPYICAEFEFGGLPAWLLADKDLQLRCDDAVFLSRMRRYYTELLTRLRPFFAVNGGNIVMLQVENEYGSFGNDKAYLRAVLDIYRQNGIDCLFFTSDGPNATMLTGGSLPDCLAVANFGSKARQNLSYLKAIRPDQPMMCGEFWCGWFDHWFEEHHVRPAKEITDEFADMLEMGASVNLYMFHGGTNFGFTNGANYDKYYAPTVTSYDYNAPLSEAGDRTETYYALRELIRSRFGSVPELTAQESKKAAYGVVSLTEAAPLFENLEKISSPHHAPTMRWMEDIGQRFGYILYRTELRGPMDGWPLRAEAVHDRAQLFVNREARGVFERWVPDSEEKAAISVPLSEGETAELSILVENMGRVNYGPKLLDRKGMQGLRSGVQYQFGWEMYPLPMEDLSGLSFRPVSNGPLTGPVFLRGTLEIEEPADTFLSLPGFTKGFVKINGHNIGRYFNPAGPQKTLYVPAPFLRAGKNEILVFESDGTLRKDLLFSDKPELSAPDCHKKNS